MKKLSESKNSKRYLESKFGIKSKDLSEKMQKRLSEAGQAANEKIAQNNSIYQQSNSRNHLYPVEQSLYAKGLHHSLNSDYILEYEDDFYQRYLMEEEDKFQDQSLKPNQKIKK